MNITEADAIRIIDGIESVGTANMRLFPADADYWKGHALGALHGVALVTIAVAESSGAPQESQRIKEAIDAAADRLNLLLACQRAPTMRKTMNRASAGAGVLR